MKVRLMKCADGALVPTDDVEREKILKLEVGKEYHVEVCTSQNGKLHRKIFSFFAFCTKHYYGDSEAHKDSYQLDYVRRRLMISAGYCKQVLRWHII